MPRLARLLLPPLLMASTGARAQITGFFGNRGPFLDRADLVQADDAARRLLQPRPAVVGASETWAEPSSGDVGTLTVQRVYQSPGRDCRAVQ